MSPAMRSIDIRAPLPSTPEGLKDRLEELIAARKAITQEIQDINGYLPAGEPVTCLRCNNTWRPRNDVIKPKACPKCKASRWDRPRKYERPDLKGQPRYWTKKVENIPPRPYIHAPSQTPIQVPFTIPEITGLTPPPVPPGFTSPSTVPL